MPRVSLVLVVSLGLSQLVAWGALHYIIGVFGADMAAALGWSDVVVHGGFSAALVVMGLSSRRAGHWIDVHGGRRVMMAGCWTGAAGCLLLASSHDVLVYYLAWCVLGLAMRLALYDAAFATLVKVAGPRAGRAITAITLFGGLASTAFWPLGHALAQAHGWRGALLAYAAILALASLLHLAIPTVVAREASARQADPAGHAAPALADLVPRTVLYGVGAMLTLFMQAGMAAHFLELLAGLGWSMARVVSLSTLLGLGQVTGRLCMVLVGHRFHAVTMNLLPPILLICSYLMYFAGHHSVWLAGAFAFLYGTGNGIATITRGSVPIVLFGATGYGARVGAILKPAFFASAVAPMAFAIAIGGLGFFGIIAINLGLCAVMLAASVALLRYRDVTKEG